MKLIIPWYKLIVQAFKHHNLEKKICPRDPHVPFWKEDFKESWNLWKKKWTFFEKVTRKSNAPSPKNFFFKWRKGLMPLVQRLFFFFWKFFSLFEKDLEILNFFLFFYFFFCFLFLIYILKQSSLNAIWNFWIKKKKHRNMK